jgi:hypothetical protein
MERNVHPDRQLVPVLEERMGGHDGIPVRGDRGGPRRGGNAAQLPR